MPLFRRLVILGHRYLGILISLVFVNWFVSAFTMMYTGGMPGISQIERIARTPELDLETVQLPLAEVIPAGYTVQAARLESLQDRPLYRLADPDGRQLNVFADNGALLAQLDIESAAAVAAAFLGIDKALLAFNGTVTEPDQWTLTVARKLPLYKFDVMDGPGTEIYVDPGHAEAVVYTTSRTRLLAWLGAIPHWFYLTGLRSNQPIWYQVVVWSAVAGCGLTILGLIIAVLQYGRSRPFRIGRGILYRGWIRLHYLCGLIFGVFILTWVFSGLLSMEPFAWTRTRGLDVPDTIFSAGPFNPEFFDLPGLRRLNEFPGKHEYKFIEFLQIQGRPYYLAGLDNTSNSIADTPPDRYKTAQILVDVRTMSIVDKFDAEKIIGILDTLAGPEITEAVMLEQYDNYYYSRMYDRPLPVLRVKFNDVAQTWTYIDPGLSRTVYTISKWERLERWLYKGLHSLDFPFWYHRRPLWDAGVIILLAGGLITSLIGFYLGITRLVKDIRNILFNKT